MSVRHVAVSPLRLARRAHASSPSLPGGYRSGARRTAPARPAHGPRAPPPATTLSPGDKVAHRLFGHGLVLKVSETPDSTTGHSPAWRSWLVVDMARQRFYQKPGVSELAV